MEPSTTNFNMVAGAWSRTGVRQDRLVQTEQQGLCFETPAATVVSGSLATVSSGFSEPARTALVAVGSRSVVGQTPAMAGAAEATPHFSVLAVPVAIVTTDSRSSLPQLGAQAEPVRAGMGALRDRAQPVCAGMGALLDLAQQVHSQQQFQQHCGAQSLLPIEKSEKGPSVVEPSTGVFRSLEHLYLHSMYNQDNSASHLVSSYGSPCGQEDVINLSKPLMKFPFQFQFKCKCIKVIFAIIVFLCSGLCSVAFHRCGHSPCATHLRP